MTYKEVVEKVRKDFGKSDVSNYEDHLAIQINIEGEGAGVFYLEINEGKLSIEEFDYNDNNAEISASAEDVVSIFSGKTDLSSALDNGSIRINGDHAKALSIQPIIDNNKKATKKTAVKKTPEKKPAAKPAASKATGKKTAAKTTTSKSTKSTAKAGAKKPAPKKK